MSSIQPSYSSRWADPPPGFSWTSYPQGPAVTRVTLSGELDLVSARYLDDALSDAARGNAAVILDLSEVTFMDSSGLHAILTAHARLADADCRLVLLRASHQVQQIFQLTGAT